LKDLVVKRQSRDQEHRSRLSRRQRGSTDVSPPEFGDAASEGSGDRGTSEMAEPADGCVEGGTGAGGV
jgi:hypothetical protein